MEVMYTKCTTVDSSWVEGLQAYVYRGGSGSEMAGALQFTNVLQGKYSMVGGSLPAVCGRHGYSIHSEVSSPPP